MVSSKNSPLVARRDLPYQGYFDVHVDLLETPCGKKMDYTSVDLKVHAAAVLARTKEGKLIVTKEYRHPTNTWVLGCPGGRIDPGETPLEAGLRELQEEAGYQGTKAHLLGKAFPLPAVTGQIVHYLFVDEAVACHNTNHEPFEFIKIEELTLSDLRTAIQRGDCVDGILCTALFLAHDLMGSIGQ